jgi:predicted N-acetyltransferase YhbS
MTLLLAPRIPDPTLTIAGVRFAAERPQDRAQVDALVDGAFGPGRFAKTSERVREQAPARLDLSICAWACEDTDAETLVGAVRQTPVRIGETPALFFGPIATRADQRGHGVGAALTERACAAGAAAGETLVILIGAISFFEPLGFEPVPLGRVSLAWPTDYARLLWRPLAPGALEGVAGELSPRVSA